MSAKVDPVAVFTRAEYERLPEGFPAELIEGQLVMMPAPDPSHERYVAYLVYRLYTHIGPDARSRVLGSNVDIHIDEHNVVQPDAVVLPAGTRATPRPWKIPTPVWAVEVLSPSTARRARGVKRRLYARKGIGELWIVDPDGHTIVVHDLEAGTETRHGTGETATSRTVPGFEIDVADFFDAT